MTAYGLDDRDSVPAKNTELSLRALAHIVFKRKRGRSPVDKVGGRVKKPIHLNLVRGVQIVSLMFFCVFRGSVAFPLRICVLLVILIARPS
jgi:hypothetical protein